MMSRRLETVEEIFHAALDCAPDQLSAFLEKKCVGDESLRRKVEELLAAHRKPESLIEGPLAALAKNIVEEAQTNSPVAQTISNYEILEEIGRGGMGVIYRARQRHSRRVVALKRVVSYHADSRETLERFGREAEAAASLDHPNILPIYDVGQGEDGLPFFSMKYAIGGSLQRAAPALRSKRRECVQLMAKVARAVQYAHEHGLLHRDLKPGNILLDAHGEPLVTDFGLAKWLDTNTDLTRTLTIFGTPGYIAPEQVKGPASKLTPAADVYSLGAILFDLFTGRPPFLGEHALAVIQQASEKTAPKLRSLAPALDRDLETVCARCLEREPRARYQSARALAEDLEHWLRHEPIQARRIGIFSRGLKWSRRNPTIAILVGSLLAFAAAVGVMLWERQSQRPLPIGTAAIPYKSIAVLPFQNLSADPENAFFTDGMQDEILNDLAKIADLKVISRTSVMQYRSGAKRNLRQIANELGVAHVVEGSVQRADNRVRVNTQLIDARNDAHLWAQTYDRNLADVFAIQSEVAKAIADQLQAKLSPNETRDIEQAPTADVTAFDLYSRAKTLIFSPALSNVAPQKLLDAVDLLSQATIRDPSFFLAYCELAYAHDWLYFLGNDHTSARLASAETAIQAAFRLRPDAGEAHLARARNLYWGYLDYDGALAEMEKARPTLPNDARLFELRGYIERRRGRWDESTRDLERAIDLDPRNLFMLQQLAYGYLLQRRYSEEAAVLDRALAINPNDATSRASRGLVELDWRADTRPLHQAMEYVRREDSATIKEVADRWFICAIAERDATAAEMALAAGENSIRSDAVFLSRSFGEGLIGRMANDQSKARAAFTAARAQQEKVVQSQPGYGPALCVLGLIDAGLGRKEDALREGRRAIELMPIEKDPINGAHMIEYFAITAAWADERDLAIEQLAIATRVPGTLSYGQLKLLPYWDPLRGDPRFEKIVNSLAQQ